jgi:hypothetical protein
MDAPDPSLASHLIRVTPVDVVQDDEFGMVPTYDSANALAGVRSYLGVVEQFGQSEGDEGVIYSVNGFNVTIFASDDPSVTGPSGELSADGKPIPSQSMLEWGKVPADFPLPAPGSAGPVTLPFGWAPEKVGLALADSNALDVGCWVTRAESRS